MNFYFLPNTGRDHETRIGVQWAHLLMDLDVPCVGVTADGKAPTWFSASVPIVSTAEAMPRLNSRDHLIFSKPSDYERMQSLPGSLVFHCLGAADPRCLPILRDPAVSVLTCWPHLTQFVRETARRDAIECGLSLADEFFYAGEPKQPRTVAFLSDQEEGLARMLRQVPDLRGRRLAGLSDREKAAQLKVSEFYLAPGCEDGLDLTPLEAMAAGCVVVTGASPGGADYLKPGYNAEVVLLEQRAALWAPGGKAESETYCTRLREQAFLTAQAYRMSRHRTRIRTLLEGPLAFLNS